MAVIEINKNPSKRDLNWFGVVFLAFFGLIGLVFWTKFEKPAVAKVLWTIGVVVPVFYYAVPPLRRVMYVGWMYLIFPIGFVMSHLILGTIYYLLFTPIGIMMRLVGYDPMARKPKPAGESYWIEHEQVTEPSRYFRQF